MGDTLTLGIGRAGEPYEGIGRGLLNIEGLPVNSLFDPNDLPGYTSCDAQSCPLCRAGQKLDALVNSFGYSKL